MANIPSVFLMLGTTDKRLLLRPALRLSCEVWWKEKQRKSKKKFWKLSHTLICREVLHEARAKIGKKLKMKHCEWAVTHPNSRFRKREIRRKFKLSKKSANLLFVGSATFNQKLNHRIHHSALWLGQFCRMSKGLRQLFEIAGLSRLKKKRRAHDVNPHGKQVYKDYAVIGILGDGRCLFRAVAHGACLRAGGLAPDESSQRNIADDLRNKVVDELIKRRTESEWFIEGDFDTYVKRMREPHVWGGEPELLMLSHVLRMPITVHISDKSSQGLIAIAEYGQEYGKENPIRVLFDGCGHYDALRIPGASSKL